MNTPNRQLQAGVYAVEFAMVLTLFLTLVFGVIELARAMYVFNTLQEVTRRAAATAANTDFTDQPAVNRVRQGAVFRSSPGLLVLGDPVSDEHVRIDYLALARAADGSMTLSAIPNGSLPAGPALNRVICMSDPYNANCIRFVRIRICDPGDSDVCAPATYNTIVPFVSLPLRLPMATTIVPAESLGFTPGMSPGP